MPQFIPWPNLRALILAKQEFERVVNKAQQLGMAKERAIEIIQESDCLAQAERAIVKEMLDATSPD